MRKLVYGFIVLVIVLLALPTASVFASAGCSAISGSGGTANPTFSLASNTFDEGDRIRISVTGTGTEFSLLEGGSTVGGPVALGSSLTYVIPADGAYAFSVNVTGSDGTTTAAVSCTPADDSELDGKVVICHFPPGNPAASHTIEVGASAAKAHQAHGDTLGACPPELQTRFDDFSIGITIFVIGDTGEISIWGNCSGGECQPILVTTVIQIININQVIVIGGDDDDDEDDDAEEAHFIELGDDDEPIQFFLDADLGNEKYAVIYYLHPDPTDDQVGVFQINIYENGVLISDDVLVFIDIDGDILRWTTHSFWTDLFNSTEA